jgi:hypothetical protein
MKKILEILAAIGAVIIAGFALFFGLSKNSNTAVVADNKKALDTVAVDDASLAQEAAKRETITQEAKSEEAITPSSSNVVSFFNDRK